MASTTVRRSALLAAILLTFPFGASAQDTTGSTDSPTTPMRDMSGMDHSGMQGMTLPSTVDTISPPARKPKKKHAVPKPPAAAKADDGMQGMDHSLMPGMGKDMPEESAATPAVDRASMPATHHAAMSGTDSKPGMTMGPMQGGKPPPNARSPDYSDGVTYGPMKGMDMADNAPMGMLLIDQLEAFHGSDANGQTWEAEAWYGNDVDKLWLRTGGERSGGKLEDADLEAFWNRNIATFWSTQVGVRHDFGAGPSRTWAALGVQGLSPYWFELEATAYVGQSGRTAARLRAEYEWLLTQRLILQPEAEINVYGKDDRAARIGSGLSDVQFGLRLRYEIDRQFAPYVGVNWIRRVGATADFAREDFQPVLDRQIVAGVRIWF
jgi:copper resistance protein B